MDEYQIYCVFSLQYFGTLSFIYSVFKDFAFVLHSPAAEHWLTIIRRAHKGNSSILKPLRDIQRRSNRSPSNLLLKEKEAFLIASDYKKWWHFLKTLTKRRFGRKPFKAVFNFKALTGIGSSLLIGHWSWHCNSMEIPKADGSWKWRMPQLSKECPIQPESLNLDVEFAPDEPIAMWLTFRRKSWTFRESAWRALTHNVPDLRWKWTHSYPHAVLLLEPMEVMAANCPLLKPNKHNLRWHQQKQLVREPAKAERFLCHDFKKFFHKFPPLYWRADPFSQVVAVFSNSPHLMACYRSHQSPLKPPV